MCCVGYEFMVRCFNKCVVIYYMFFNIKGSVFKFVNFKFFINNGIVRFVGKFVVIF